MSKKAKSWRDYKAGLKSKIEMPEVPEKILYVNMMVEMNTGRILPKIVPWSYLPIEVKVFFQDWIRSAKSQE